MTKTRIKEPFGGPGGGGSSEEDVKDSETIQVNYEGRISFTVVGTINESLKSMERRIKQI